MEDELQKFTSLKSDYANIQDINEKRQRCLENNSLFSHVRGKNLDKIKEIIYPVLRDNIQDELEEKDFPGAIQAFESIENTNRYHRELDANLIIVKDMLIKANLFLFL